MKAVLIDTDVLIQVLQQDDDSLLRRWNALLHEETLVLYSSLSAAEIWTMADPPDRDLVHKILGQMVCVPVDQETGRRAGQFLWLYRKSKGLQGREAMIAATSFLHNAPLWTLDHTRYPIDDLEFFS